MSLLRYPGQVAIVTGAGAGIGRATALLLASRGAKVVVNDPAMESGAGSVPVARAETVVKEIRDAGGEAIAELSAIGSHDVARRIVATAMAAYGRIDILINNAGIARPGPFDSISDNDVDAVLAVNLTGPYAMTRAVWPVMRQQSYGRIINVSSSAALGSGMSGPYAVSKSGLLGLTKEAAIAGKPFHIFVNALMPAAYTALLDKHPDAAYREWMRKRLPPEKVAAVAAYLASGELQHSGELFSAGGGRVSRIAFVESAGFFDLALTPEAVRENFAAICDLSTPTVLRAQSDHQDNYARQFPDMPKI